MAPPASSNKKIIVCYFFVAILIILFAVLIFAKVCVISFVDGNVWRELGKKRTIENLQVPAERGNIYSSNYELMAITEPYYRLYVDFWAEGIQEDTLKKYLRPLAIELNKMFPRRSVAEYENHIMKGWRQRSEKNREYRLLDEQVDYMQLKAIRQMPFFNKGRNRSGLYTKDYVKRTKPYGTLASCAIGNIYGDAERGGSSGLEKQYNDLLSGQPGTSTLRKVNGKWIKVEDVKPVKGKDIVSTIDISIQDITEKALHSKLRELDAESGTAVVMEVSSGAVRAITNMGRVREGVWNETQNYAVSDLSEPGSTFKVVSMMVALEDGVVRPDDTVDTGNGVAMIAGLEVRDHNAHRGGYGTITAAKSIRYSSNIGVAKIIQRAYGNNPAKYVDGVRRIGFLKDLHMDIPGYGVPRTWHPKEKTTDHFWSEPDLSRMSYGYVTAIPPIYILAFYNAIANKGELVKPFFVHEIREDDRVVETKKKEVINPKICSASTLTSIHQMLDDVVNSSDGTGKAVHSDKVRIAGKTGTAKLWSGKTKRYEPGEYQVSFCGYFPAGEPKYSMIVVIRKPRNGVPSGGGMCGPVFKTIAEEIYSRNIITSEKSLPVDAVLAGAVVKKSLNDVKMEAGLVPDVMGMGAKNAVYTMENAGLCVNLTGRGTVVAQSIAPGSPVTKGQTVGLQLR